MEVATHGVHNKYGQRDNETKYTASASKFKTMKLIGAYLRSNNRWYVRYITVTGEIHYYSRKFGIIVSTVFFLSKCGIIDLITFTETLVEQPYKKKLESYRQLREPIFAQAIRHNTQPHF